VRGLAAMRACVPYVCIHLLNPLSVLQSVHSMPFYALNLIADPLYCHINSIHIVKTIEHSLHVYIQSSFG
jgi:hypothetical protein